MRNLPAALFAATLAGCIATATAEDRPTTAPANKVMASDTNISNTTTADSYGDTVAMAFAPLPAGHTDAMPLEDYFKSLQVRYPHFRYVINRPGWTPDAKTPPLPALETTDLTLGELVNLINQTPTDPPVHIVAETSVSQLDPLYVVTLMQPSRSSTTAVTPHVVRAVSIRSAVQVQQRVRHEDEKAAVADVMSLVQALVESSPDGRGANLKVHEPTGMLILTGPAPLADAVSAAVEAVSRVSPEEQKQFDADLARSHAVEERLANLQDLYDELQDELRQMRGRGVLDAGREVQLVKQHLKDVATQIAELKGTTRPATGN